MKNIKNRAVFLSVWLPHMRKSVFSCTKRSTRFLFTMYAYCWYRTTGFIVEINRRTPNCASITAYTVLVYLATSNTIEGYTILCCPGVYFGGILFCVYLTITILFAGVTLCVDSSTSLTRNTPLYSINYPDVYGNNRNCITTLNFDTALFGTGIRKWVTLVIEEFSMENDFDYFRVVDDNGEHSYTGVMSGTHLCKLNFPNHSLK